VKAITTIGPSPRDAIEEDGCLASVEKGHNPLTPVLREAPNTKDVKETVPIHAVKCLVEVELEHQSWGVSAVTAVENVSGIRKTFSNTVPKNEACLITTD
jgi:formaldehyde-activating enzyme involved in methanogenesis